MNDLIANSGLDIMLLAVVIPLAYLVGVFLVRGSINSVKNDLAKEEHKREEWKNLFLSHPPGLPPGGMPTSDMVAAQLRQTYAQPFKVTSEKDKHVLQHYAGLVARNDMKNGLFSYDCVAPTTVVGPNSGRVYNMKPGDTLTVDKPLVPPSLWEIEEEVFGDRCKYCGTLQVKGTHCPNCGGHY